MLSLWAYNYDWGDVPPPPVVKVPDGGISERDYRRYRRSLEKMIAAADARDAIVYQQEAKIVKKIAEKAGVQIPVPRAEISESRTIEYRLPDFSEISIATSMLLSYIELVKKNRIDAQNELNDDMLMILLLQ